MVNKAILIGNLGKDPETRYSQSGSCICNFSLATTEKYNGESKTDWHNIVAFGKLGDICGEYLRKGSKVYISGKIQTRQWEDRDGNKRYTTEIVASEMKMLDGRSESRRDTSQSNMNGEMNQTPAMGDDVPF